MKVGVAVHNILGVHAMRNRFKNCPHGGDIELVFFTVGGPERFESLEALSGTPFHCQCFSSEAELLDAMTTQLNRQQLKYAYVAVNGCNDPWIPLVEAHNNRIFQEEKRPETSKLSTLNVGAPSAPEPTPLPQPKKPGHFSNPWHLLPSWAWKRKSSSPTPTAPLPT